ncbi:chloride channel protein [Xanthobacter sp. KR7-225]|uniref:chloride channel protein n=1 Tax=Xanthobacter sp. KR7-225 TaxID=3156613 RepID=UPI0032B35FE7
MTDAPADPPQAGGPRSHLARLLASAQASARSREVALVLIAAVMGVLAGLAASAMSAATQWAHEWLYGLSPGERLSASPALLSPWLVLVPAAGGAAMGLIALALKRWRDHPIVDPIEANALHGGRMSLVDSIIVSAQTMVSNGFGASLGLEAGYSQIGAGIASRLGQTFALRRNDLRILVGAGAAAGIGAAFDAPLMGAFYGFEIIIGCYSIPAAAPVLAATIVAVMTARVLGAHVEPLNLPLDVTLAPIDIVPVLGLGLVAALVAVIVMRLVTGVEAAFARSRIPAPLRPVVAGLMVGALALYSPQVLSDGHGALHRQVESAVTLSVAMIFGFKILASALSIGSGFRGGLFFASLFLGALMGKLYGGLLALAWPALHLDPAVVAVVGMGALAVGIIGGPLTMSFLVLEMTRDLALTGYVLAAAVTTSLAVRGTFGYSFSTWRFHLRGEAIRSAQDIGWMRELSVGRMMRTEFARFPAAGTIGALRAAIPLGAHRVVALVDDAGAYRGLVQVAAAHAPSQADDALAASIARQQDAMLLPAMSVKEAALGFDAAHAEDLAVVEDRDGRRLVGLLGEAYVLKRYARELDRARRGLGAED